MFTHVRFGVPALFNLQQTKLPGTIGRGTYGKFKFGGGG